MVVPWDLGLAQGLVLCACGLLPLIGFVIRRKWRRSVERSREIKRLLVLASEEDARAELEASVGYGAFSAPPRGYQCAICLSPTTRRCTRCKAVRYCSGKCQIIHWRQGHKEECHPPEPGTDYILRATKFEEDVDCGDKLENAIGDATKSIEVFVDGPTLEDSNSSSTTSSEKNSNIKVESESCLSKSSSAKFSGFSGSTGSNELSGDDSISESVSSNDSGSSDEDRSLNVGQNMPGTICDDDGDDAKPPSPKFASLVGSVYSYASLDESNKKPGCNDVQEQCDLKSESMKSPSDQTVEPSVDSSNFWKGVVDPIEKRNIISNSSLPPKFNHANFSDVSSRSHTLFSSSRSQSNEQVSHIKGFKEERFMSSNGLPRNKFDKEPTLSGKVVNSGLSATKRPFLNCESSSRIGDDDTTFVSSGAPYRQEYASRRNATVVGVRHPIPSVNTTESDKVQHSIALPSQSAACSFKALHNVESSVDSDVDQLKGSVSSKWYLAGDRSDTSGKYNDKGLFSYDLFVKLYTWKEVDLLPCGFVNCGNSCYANAVLQCLAFTPPLTAYFLQGLHSKLCPKEEWCFMCEFESLIQKAKEGASPISPIRIVSQLQKIGSQLHNGREEDAHEFLRYAIDAMQSICLVKSVEMESGSSQEETTLVGLTFGGYLRSKIRCTKCQVKSERHERMMDLTVEIEGDIGTLEQALHRFTENETLDGENKYLCSRCKSYEKARKRLTILEAPNVLTIALKRFQSGKFGKLNKLIHFPEILNLAPYMSGTSDKSPIYRLYGVIVHLDVMNAAFCGHYVCYVKNPRNKWFKIDDCTVTPVELESVLSMGAYMLLYARCSPRAPRSIRDKIISADPKHKAVLARYSGKIAALSTKPLGRSSSDIDHNSMSSDGSTNIESFYSKFHRLQRILEENSSSDNSSLFSSTSDEGSCSTDGTRDSASADDFSEYIFGDPVRSWSSSWRNSSDSDTSSSSSSPLYSRHSPLANSEGHALGFTETNPSQREGLDSGLRGDEFLKLDNSKWRRELEISSSSSRSGNSSRRRETELERLAWLNGSYDVKNGVSLRRSARERTD